MKERLYEGVNWLTQTPQGTLFLLLVILALVVFLIIDKEDYWGKSMKQQRRENVDTLAVDGFVSHVEDMVANQIVTREEATEVYIKLKKSFPIRDLFPSVAVLKANIQKRLTTEAHQPIPAPLPDVKKEKKHAFSKLSK